MDVLGITNGGRGISLIDLATRPVAIVLQQYDVPLAKMQRPRTANTGRFINSRSPRRLNASPIRKGKRNSRGDICHRAASRRHRMLRFILQYILIRNNYTIAETFCTLRKR